MQGDKKRDLHSLYTFYMDLRYASHPPLFTLNGLSSLNTRPFLAVHRDQYHKCPRLYPVQLTADCLTSPPRNHNEQRWGEQKPPLHSRQSTITYEHASGGRQAEGKLPCDPVMNSSSETQGLESELHSLDDLFHKTDQSIAQANYIQEEGWRTAKSEATAPICVALPDVQDAFCYMNESELSASQPICNPRKSNCTLSGNILARLSFEDRNAVVFSATGLLDSVTVADIEVEEQNGIVRHVLKRSLRTSHIPDFLMFDRNPILDLTTPHAIPKGVVTAALLATTVEGLSYATIEEDGFLWKDQFSLSGVASSSFNPIFQEEFSVVSEDGLFAGTSEDLNKYLSQGRQHELFMDIQTVSPNTQFRQLHYGAHPRTVLLANRGGIRRYDLRSPECRWTRDSVLNIQEDWGMSNKSIEIATFQPLRNDGGFKLAIATKTSLCYIDIRMSHTPILDWSLSLPSFIDNMVLCELNETQIGSDIIALSSRKHQYLEAFHGVHGRSEDAENLEFQLAKGMNETLWSPSLMTSEILWSDLPLAHLQQLRVSSARAGITLVPHRGGNTATLLQFSVADGLTAQLLGVDIFRDRERMFERVPQEMSLYAENSLIARRYQNALEERGEHLAPTLVKNSVLRSVPGCSLLRKSRQMFTKDAIDLRERICCCDDDDIAKGNGHTRLPRPFLRDIVHISQHRSDLTDLVGEHDDNPSGQNQTGSVNCRRVSEGACSEHSNTTGGAEMGSITEAIGGGSTIDNVARHVRSGMAHSPTPLGLAGLKNTVKDSPFVTSWKVAWNSTCLELHSGSFAHVDSKEPMPDWVADEIFCAVEIEAGESIRSFQIPEDSEYGRLLSRMQLSFFS